MQSPCPRPSWARIGTVLATVALALSPTAPTLDVATTHTDSVESIEAPFPTSSRSCTPTLLGPSRALAAEAVDKSETVHVQTDPEGGVTSVAVEELLANNTGAATLQDRTSLTNIEPEDEDQSYRLDADGSLTWSAQGKRVAYRGTSDGTPPVDISLTYRLDGIERKPAELAGASGRLTIRIDYRLNTTSNAAAQQDTEGRGAGAATRTAPPSTPFACMTVALLDGDIFSNVQATNAKVIDDKGGLAVIGYALPGLHDSLGLDDQLDVDLPEHLEISADVVDLALDPIYTIVTPELFGELDTDGLRLDELSDLDEGTEALGEALSALISGSDALTGTLGQLAGGSGQLGEGARALREALGELPSGTAALSSGTHAIADGLHAASDGAGQLADGADQLSQAARAAHEGTTAAAEGIRQARAGAADLRDALARLSATQEALGTAGETVARASDAAQSAQRALEGLASAFATRKEPVSTTLDEATSALDSAQGQLTGTSSKLEETAATLADIPTDNLTPEQEEALARAKATLAEAASGLSATDAQLDAATGSITQAHKGLDSLTAEAPQSLADDITTLNASAQALSGGAKGIEAAASALDGARQGADALVSSLDTATEGTGALAEVTSGVADGAGGLAEGARSLSSSLTQAASGASDLAKATDKLADSAPQLLSGVDQLNGGLSQLTDALRTTADGSSRLGVGLTAFGDEGIRALEYALAGFRGDLDDLRGRLDDLRAAAASYDSFAGKAEGQTSSVRFIFKTARIG